MLKGVDGSLEPSRLFDSMPPGLSPLFRIGPLRRTLVSFRILKPYSFPSPSPSDSCSCRSLPRNLVLALISSASFSASSPASGRSDASRRSRPPRGPGTDTSMILEIVSLISEDSVDLESKLRRLNVGPSHALVSEVLRASNHHGISALRFFNWVLESYPSFRFDSDAYNQMICNVGLFDDYNTMRRILEELSSKGHSLTEKAFSFLAVRGAAVINESVVKLAEMLNQVGGSCRGSGTFSLIKFLCSLNSFDLAIWVMGETARRTSYYNVLIAAKCRSLDFDGARDVFVEMRRIGYDPNTKSYNYLLGGLFKNKRFVEACDLLQTMEELGYLPDSSTFEIVLIHACKANRMNFAIKFLDRMLAEGFKPSIATHAAFIKGYFRSGCAEDAYRYAMDMRVKDNYSVNMNFSLLANLYCTSGRIEEASKILHEMMDRGLKPNFPVYMKVAKSFYKMSRGDLASELKTKYQKFNFHTDIS